MAVRSIRDHFNGSYRKAGEVFDWTGPLHRHIEPVTGKLGGEAPASGAAAVPLRTGTCRIRFRKDRSHDATLKAEGVTVEKYRDEWNTGADRVALFEATLEAEPGDTWRIRWYAEDGEGPIAGYAICCPRCGQVHYWTTALNCKPCPHQGKSSCWQWSGSAEAGTLTASPSLFAQRACGWHGWLRNGELTEC